MMLDLIDASWSATGETTPDGAPVIGFSPRMRDVVNELREFMFSRVYLYGETHREAEQGTEIVKFLVSRGANLKVQNKRGQTPLAAAMASRKELGHLVEILKAAEAQ